MKIVTYEAYVAVEGGFKLNTQKYWSVLGDVVDPEFPISVVDMGLIRDIRVTNRNHLVVTLTYTSVACACMEWIQADVKQRLLQEPDVEEVEIAITWDPPWTVECLTQRGKQIFAEWGLSVS